MNHSEFIFSLVKGCRYQSYLELGVFQGETLSMVSSLGIRCKGVDMNNHGVPGHLDMFWGSTDDFFKRNAEMFDCIFIDADHHIESVSIDLSNAIFHLNRGGTIILHDTNPIRRELFADGYCSDCYKIVDLLATSDRYNAVTLPLTDAGITI
jgi:predicted O-methyltransferase YrrM